MMRGPIALAAFAALAWLPLAADAATTTVVGGVVVIDGADAPPARALASASRGASSDQTGRSQGDRPSQAPPQVNSPLADSLVHFAMSFVGVPYVWAGASPSGFDCSGFTQYVFRQLGVAIPRTADAQFAAGRPVADPMPGDLVFFQTYDWGASHVGIYLGGGYFLNAIQRDVHVSSFASEYFRGRYLGARRFIST